MTKPPNPVTTGMCAVLRDPAIFLLEILWRWTFASLAFLVLLATGAVLLGPLPNMQQLPAVMNSHDPQMIGFFWAAVAMQLGRKLIVTAIIVPVAIILVWSLLSALGRHVTVKRLRAGEPTLRFRSILALHLLRGFFLWICTILLLAAVVGEILIATKSSSPNLGLFYIMLTPSILIIGIFWLAANWYLTLATIFGRPGQSFRGAFREVRQTVARQRSDFAGTGFVFLIMKIVLLLIVLAILGLTSQMVGTSPQSYFTLAAVVTTVYFVASDFLYIARLATYLALAATQLEPGKPELMTSPAKLPFENSSTS